MSERLRRSILYTTITSISPHDYIDQPALDIREQPAQRRAVEAAA
jgi:hypothetical protein